MLDFLLSPAMACYVLAAALVFGVWYLFAHHRQRMPDITLHDLGVAEGYNFMGLHEEAIAQYENIKQKLCEKFAGGQSDPDE